MNTVSKSLLVVVALFLILHPLAFAESPVEDWAYELSDQAKDAYLSKRSVYSCASIGSLLKAGDYQTLYLTIRDAGLFKREGCRPGIQQHLSALSKIDGVKDATAYYLYVFGDKQKLKLLAESFDKDARRVGDHWMVELFGLIPDWEIAGRRLVRHAAYADGASAELLCSALMWRRFLYGEVEFERNWFRIGRQENVPADRLADRFNKCLR